VSVGRVAARSCTARSVFIGKLKDQAASLSRYPRYRSRL
jgi:hypothetical protein